MLMISVSDVLRLIAASRAACCAVCCVSAGALRPNGLNVFPNLANKATMSSGDSSLSSCTLSTLGAFGLVTLLGIA